MGSEKKQIKKQFHDRDTYAHQLSLADHLRKPVIRSAIQTLNLPPGSRGLDAGCGIGSHTLMLAEAVAPDGHITGLDLSPEFLAQASNSAEQSGLSKQVSFREGDLNNLPFDDDAFEWVWTMDTLWPGPKEMGNISDDPLPLVEELSRVVKPGGIVAILFWSSQVLLPGYPLLEARLNSAFEANSPFDNGKIKPELHHLRALGWLQTTGLKESTTRTYIADVHAPLSEDIRDALTMTFQMFWGEKESDVTPEDWAEFQRLCQPESPDFILNIPDYYAFLTYSMFYGRVAE